MKPIHLLAVGELLVDLIGHELATNLADTRDFHRYQGGSPANLAANMARLGNRSALVACVGADNLGVYLRERVAEAGVITDHIATDAHEPTSVVLVSRTTKTPDFIIYRTADCQLHPYHLPNELLAQARVFHTTFFALGRNPARDTILDAARRAAALGCRVSIDVNYAPVHMPDRQQARQVVAEYCASGALVKLSEDDAARLYGELQTNEKVISDFHDMGASLVCLTLGAEGSLVSAGPDEPPVRLLGKKLEVIDATGAGDAFWAGFLTAWLDGHDAAICAQAGANMAALKLTTIGRLPASVPKGVLFDQA